MSLATFFHADVLPRYGVTFYPLESRCLQTNKNVKRNSYKDISVYCSVIEVSKSSTNMQGLIRYFDQRTDTRIQQCTDSMYWFNDGEWMYTRI